MSAIVCTNASRPYTQLWRAISRYERLAADRVMTREHPPSPFAIWAHRAQGLLSCVTPLFNQFPLQAILSLPQIMTQTAPYPDV